MLDEAADFYNKRDFGEIDIDKNIPTHVQVADEAWKLLNLPKSETKNQTVLLSDCWGIYAEKKELDVQDRQIRKTFHRWNYFFDFVGDCVLTNEEIHERLDRYVTHREQCRKDAVKAGKKATPSSSTIHKEINMACAIINQAARLHRLPININKPDIRDTEPKERETLSPQEVIAIVELAQDTQSGYYKSWKELAILIMAQTSCIASELQRMEKSSIFLDADIPVIKVKGKVKTKNRLRTIPLVYKVDRIRALINTIDPESKYIFGDMANTTESNISKQLKNILEKVNPKATAYSFRHAFKNNAQINDIDNQDVAYLGGWSGSSLSVNEIMMNYGRKGLETPEMALKLQRVMRRINKHLLQSESTVSNVFRLPA
jgi:integrase